MKEIIGNAQEADWHHLCRALILLLSVAAFQQPLGLSRFAWRAWPAAALST